MPALDRVEAVLATVFVAETGGQTEARPGERGLELVVAPRYLHALFGRAATRRPPLTSSLAPPIRET
jgi:hypothetical protein